MIAEADLERIAEEYRREGYVVESPPGDLGVELVATRGRETVAVQVKRNRFDVADDADLVRRAAAVNARPGWRFDLVVLERSPPFRDPQEPSDEQFEELLRRVEKAKETGLNEMALTFACASLEAALRRARNETDASSTATELLNAGYSNGLMTPQEFDTARRAWELRNRAVHGLVLPPIQPSLIGDVLAVARKLRGGRAA